MKKIILYSAILSVSTIFVLTCGLPFLIHASMAIGVEMKSRAADTQIEALEIAVLRVGVDTGIALEPQSGLIGLVERPNNMARNLWNGPYIRKSALKDPWGQPYRYAVNAADEKLEIYSIGIDGLSKSDGNDLDDINNWNPEKSWSSHYRAIDRANEITHKVTCVFILMLVLLFAYRLVKMHCK